MKAVRSLRRNALFATVFMALAAIWTPGPTAHAEGLCATLLRSVFGPTQRQKETIAVAKFTALAGQWAEVAHTLPAASAGVNILLSEDLARSYAKPPPEPMGSRYQRIARTMGSKVALAYAGYHLDAADGTPTSFLRDPGRFSRMAILRPEAWPLRAEAIDHEGGKFSRTMGLGLYVDPREVLSGEDTTARPQIFFKTEYIVPLNDWADRTWVKLTKVKKLAPRWLADYRRLYPDSSVAAVEVLEGPRYVSTQGILGSSSQHTGVIRWNGSLSARDDFRAGAYLLSRMAEWIKAESLAGRSQGYQTAEQVRRRAEAARKERQDRTTSGPRLFY